MSPGKSPSGIGHHGHTSPSPAQRVLNFSYPTESRTVKQRFVVFLINSKLPVIVSWTALQEANFRALNKEYLMIIFLISH